MTYYLDANIVSYLLKGNKDIFSKLSDLASKDHTISIPNIVYIDLLIAQTAIDNDVMLLANDSDFLNIAKIIPELKIFEV